MKDKFNSVSIIAYCDMCGVVMYNEMTFLDGMFTCHSDCVHVHMPSIKRFEPIKIERLGPEYVFYPSTGRILDVRYDRKFTYEEQLRYERIVDRLRIKKLTVDDQIMLGHHVVFIDGRYRIMFEERFATLGDQHRMLFDNDTKILDDKFWFRWTAVSFLYGRLSMLMPSIE